MNAVFVTPSMPCNAKFCPVRNKLGIGVFGDSIVMSGLRQSFLMPKADPKGDSV